MRLVFIVLIAMHLLPSLARSSEITGLWVDNEGTIFEIKSCEKKICGRIAGFAEISNEANRAAMEFCGVMVIRNLEPSNKEWIDGIFFDPENNTLYNTSVRMKNGNLRVRVYVKTTFFSEYLLWKPFDQAAAKDAVLCNYVKKQPLSETK